MNTIQYKKGYHYQLVNMGIRVEIPNAPDVSDDRSPFATIQDSVLHIQPGYAWDGASGPAIDTSSFMVGSCVHDVICQLTDLDLLPYEWRKWGDLKLVEICRANGMSRLRGWWVLRAVRWNSERNASRRAAEPFHRAPAKGVVVFSAPVNP